jgi:hypothetical protein
LSVVSGEIPTTWYPAVGERCVEVDRLSGAAGGEGRGEEVDDHPGAGEVGERDRPVVGVGKGE